MRRRVAIHDSGDAMGQTLEDEGRRAEDEGQIRWTRVQMGKAQRRLLFSWSDAFCESCDRLLGIEDGHESFEVDAVDAYYQALEHEEVVVNLRRSTLNVLLKLEGTRTLCGDCGVTCMGDAQRVRAGWNTWLEFL